MPAITKQPRESHVPIGWDSETIGSTEPDALSLGRI